MSLGMFKSRAWVWAVLVVAVIVCWRSHQRLLAPTMQVEDGASIFAHFYVNRDWIELVRFKAGYIPFLPNLLGYLFVRLPATYNPYLFTIVPTIFTIFAYSLFAFPRYRALVPDDRIRALTVTAIALAPIGQYFLLSHTDYSIWNALYLLLIWSFLPFADTRLRAYGAFGVQQILVWTNPLSFVAAPLNVLHFLEGRGRQRLLQLGMVVSHALHIKFGLAERKEGPASRILQLDQEMLQRFYAHVVEHELFRAVFGPDVVDLASERAPWSIPVFGCVVFALLLWALLRPSAYVSRRALLMTVFAILTLTWIILVSRSDRAIARGWRYVYVQCIFCVVLWCLLLGQLVRAMLARWKFYRQGFALGYPGLVATWFALQNVSEPGGYAASFQRNVDNVRKCMRDIEKQEARNGGPCGIRVTCKKRRDWPIRIKTKRCSSE